MKLINASSPFSIRDTYFIAFVLLVVSFILFKIPHLFLPYFWDEAWSYIPAVTMLRDSGLSLLPDALPPEVSRGHPLMFYFSAAAWMSLFGDSLLSMHLFGLAISLLLLTMIYITGRNLFSPAIAVSAVCAFCLQAVFMAQSALVLPEVMLSLLSLASIYFFINQKFLWFVISATCMLLTKETGAVVICAVSGWVCLEGLIGHRRISLNLFIRLGIALLPVVIASVFFIVQYYMRGWFFFPEHIGMIRLDKHQVIEKFRYCYEVICQHQGRSYFSLFALAGAVVYFFRGPDETNEVTNIKRIKFIGISVLFILIMMIYSSVNFFTDRYLLCLLPVYFLIGFYLISSLFNTGNMLFILLFVGLSVQFIRYNFEKHPPADYNLSFADGVRVQKDITAYAESNNLYSKQIYVSFLYGICLSNQAVKYRSNNIVFTGLNNRLSCENDYLVYSNIEGDPAFEELRKTCNLYLMKRFRRGKVWAEVYRVNK